MLAAPLVGRAPAHCQPRFLGQPVLGFSLALMFAWASLVEVYFVASSVRKSVGTFVRQLAGSGDDLIAVARCQAMDQLK